MSLRMQIRPAGRRANALSVITLCNCSSWELPKDYRKTDLKGVLFSWDACCPWGLLNWGTHFQQVPNACAFGQSREERWLFGPACTTSTELFQCWLWLLLSLGVSSASTLPSPLTSCRAGCWSSQDFKALAVCSSFLLLFLHLLSPTISLILWKDTPLIWSQLLSYFLSLECQMIKSKICNII